MWCVCSVFWPPPDWSRHLSSPPLSSPARPARHQHQQHQLSSTPSPAHLSHCTDRHFVLTRRDCVVGRCPGLLRVLWDCGAILLSPLSTPAVAVLLWSRASTVSPCSVQTPALLTARCTTEISSLFTSQKLTTLTTPSLPPSLSKPDFNTRKKGDSIYPIRSDVTM